MALVRPLGFCCSRMWSPNIVRNVATRSRERKPQNHFEAVAFFTGIYSRYFLKLHIRFEISSFWGCVSFLMNIVNWHLCYLTVIHEHRVEDMLQTVKQTWLQSTHVLFHSLWQLSRRDRSNVWTDLCSRPGALENCHQQFRPIVLS